QRVSVVTAPTAPGRLDLPVVSSGAGLPSSTAAPVQAPAEPEARTRLRTTAADGSSPVEGFQVAGLAALGFLLSYLLAGRVRRQWQRRQRHPRAER
ncbi:MAG: hypothetical protein JWN54_3452, partial [Mycobacterium sp.]|nr:hypothetical protein [Mycobacterium sp.]